MLAHVIPLSELSACISSVTWLCANRVSLPVDKSKYYVIFHPVQKKISLNDVHLMINDKILKNDSLIKYLGWEFILTPILMGKYTLIMYQRSKESLVFYLNYDIL